MLETNAETGSTKTIQAGHGKSLWYEEYGVFFSNATKLGMIILIAWLGSSISEDFSNIWMVSWSNFFGYGSRGGGLCERGGDVVV